jgi:hypothetical protein
LAVAADCNAAAAALAETAAAGTATAVGTALDAVGATENVITCHA